MIDLFEDKVDLTNITCHSGGAEGSDSYWESIGVKYGVKTKAYSYIPLTGHSELVRRYL